MDSGHLATSIRIPNVWDSFQTYISFSWSPSFLPAITFWNPTLSSNPLPFIHTSFLLFSLQSYKSYVGKVFPCEPFLSLYQLLGRFKRSRRWSNSHFDTLNYIVGVKLWGKLMLHPHILGWNSWSNEYQKWWYSCSSSQLIGTTHALLFLSITNSLVIWHLSNLVSL